MKRCRAHRIASYAPLLCASARRSDAYRTGHSFSSSRPSKGGGLAGDLLLSAAIVDKAQRTAGAAERQHRIWRCTLKTSCALPASSPGHPSPSRDQQAGGRLVLLCPPPAEHEAPGRGGSVWPRTAKRGGGEQPVFDTAGGGGPAMQVDPHFARQQKREADVSPSSHRVSTPFKHT